MEKKIVCEFTKRELETLYNCLVRHYVSPTSMPDFHSAKAEIERKLKPNDLTINSTSSWP